MIRLLNLERKLWAIGHSMEIESFLFLLPYDMLIVYRFLFTFMSALFFN